MEPVSTTTMIATVVGYLAKKLKDSKSVQDFFNDFTEASVKWIRPLFLKKDLSYPPFAGTKNKLRKLKNQ
jgi:hypothetical protein